MPKTRRAKKRRLARALVHQQKTRHGNVADTAPWADPQHDIMADLRASNVPPADTSPTVDFVERELGLPTTTLQQRPLEEFAPPSTHATGSAVDVNADPPNRAKCPHCGNRQKVRKDGTFGKHAYTATDTSTCIGTDARWDA